MPNHIIDSASQIHALATANMDPNETMISSREVEALLGIRLPAQSNRRAQKLVVCKITPLAGKTSLHTVYPESFVHSLQDFLGQRTSTWEIWLLHLIHYTRSRIKESDYQLLKQLCQDLTEAGILMRFAEARDALGLSRGSFQGWIERGFLAVARLDRYTAYLAAGCIAEQAKILALKNVKQAAIHLGISPEEMCRYSNRGKVGYIRDASGHKHFTEDHLAALKQKLDQNHFLNSQETADRLDLNRRAIAVYHRRGLLRGEQHKKSALVFPESEVRRAEKELSEYVICAGFEWLEEFLGASRLKTNQLTIKQVSRILGDRPVPTLTRWKLDGLIPFYVQKFYENYAHPPAFFYPEIYFQRLKTLLNQQPLSRELVVEFRDQCAKRGRLPLA